METKNWLGTTGIAIVGALPALVLSGTAAGQVTSRVSVSSAGAGGNSFSLEPTISANGRYVAFHSLASNLVGGDTNVDWDIFVHDRQSGTTERVSVNSGGAQGNGASIQPSISADGRYVAFYSQATNLVGGDTNGYADVFVHDRQSGTTQRVSVDSGGAQGNFISGSPAISADGRYVAFQSAASNFVGGDTNGSWDIFVHDSQSGTTERVSVNSGGTQGNGGSESPSISADGRNVAFWSASNNLVGGDTNGVWDVFVRDRQSGTTERVSVDSTGAQGNLGSHACSISADGRYVAFDSVATNLVVGDTNGSSDIFVRDRQGGTTERMSVGSGGVQADGYSTDPSISADGRHLAFYSQATNLVGGDSNAAGDAFVHDRQSGTTERVSVDSSGAQANDYSYFPAISDDGRYVTFESNATNLVGGDTNGFSDIFVRDQSTGVGWKYCTANTNSTGSPADLSASGSASSGAGNLMLTSSPVPNQNGLFFHGANQSLFPFGNGLLCTTGGLVRGAVVLGGGNVATYTYNNSDSKHSLAAYVGTTRNFQYWFRDSLGGGAFSNTSSAISIVILP